MEKKKIRKIAENAFRAHFSDFEIVRIDVNPRIDHDGDRVVDVNIYCDGNYKKLRGPGLLRVQSDIVTNAWRKVKNDLGFPLVHFYSKPTLKRHDAIASKKIRNNSSNSQLRRSTGLSASH